MVFSARTNPSRGADAAQDS